ncbi:MAG: T9SS type A sorting domain-containing protein, partial [Bacteroidales bacterium]|nr:T9SS type A sorting domain-containing protein [Bacteroidales bacterium]
FTLSEALDNDLQMKFAQMEWDDENENTVMSPYFMIPKSHLNQGSYTNFKASALNFGEYDQEEAFFSVDITKNNQNVFHAAGDKKNIYTLLTDTTLITDKYTPTEFGHYKTTYKYQSNATDDTPENNEKSVYFNVTDSVFSHADGTAEEACNWGIETYKDDGSTIQGHIVGVKYYITKDCEANSISAFIAGGLADGRTDFRFALHQVPADSDPLYPVELMVSDYLSYDSTMIGKWITLPLTKDGETEMLKAGDLVYAAVEYNIDHTEYQIQRYDGFKIGADYSFKLLDPVGVAKGKDAGWSNTGFISERNLMIRLNINEHGNGSDGVDLTRSAAKVGQNYPNPFSQTTDIDYVLTSDSEVSITVMDLTGRVVMELNQGKQPAGSHNVKIDAGSLDSGIYLYTLKAGANSETRRMTVSR